MNKKKEIKEALKAEIESMIEDIAYYGIDENPNFMANPTMFIIKWMSNLADILKETDKS